jgi:hypothetical protein
MSLMVISVVSGLIPRSAGPGVSGGSLASAACAEPLAAASSTDINPILTANHAREVFICFSLRHKFRMVLLWKHIHFLSSRNKTIILFMPTV